MLSKAKPNDPCPCGSGRKFKKCCMAASGRNDYAADEVVGEVEINGVKRGRKSIAEFLEAIGDYTDEVLADPQTRCQNCGAENVASAGIVIPFAATEEKFRRFCEMTGKIQMAIYATCEKCHGIDGMHDRIRDQLLEKMGVDPSSDN